MDFYPYSFEEKGPAYFIRYKRGNSIVEFLFGPSDWDIEMIIYTSNGKYAFRDLVQIQEILKWINENRYQQLGQRNIKKELMWFVELLKISLPIIE